MLSSLLRTLSPSRGAALSPRHAAADSTSFIQLPSAVQASGANDLVLVDDEGLRAVVAPPRSPMSPSAYWRRKRASAARTLIADRFARALPTGVSRDRAATPFNTLTDADAVRVYQLRLLVAMVKFERDLVAGGMASGQASTLSMQAFNPATWNCGDTQALYHRIKTRLIDSNDFVVRACLAAAKADSPPASEQEWRLELETANGAITQRRRSLAPQPDTAPVAPSASAVSLRVSRSLADELSDAAPPPPAPIPQPPLPTALAARGASPPPSSREERPLAEPLGSISMYGFPSPASLVADRPAHRRGGEQNEAERARRADTKGQLLGLSTPERPTRLADLHDWGRRLAEVAPYCGSGAVSGRQASGQAQAHTEARIHWHRDWLPALQGLHETITRASGRPLSNRFRDELLRWPLSVRASLLRCSADRLPLMDPRGGGWAPAYRFHAELARALTADECYTAQEQQLKSRVLGAVRAQAQVRKPVIPNFPEVVAAVRAIFTRASTGIGSADMGIPPFALQMDSLNRRQASYNPLTRTVLIGPQFLHEQSPMPYVLRHVAAAAMHFYNHRLIDALAANERHEDNPDRQIGSMLHALVQVPITAEALKIAGLRGDQADLLVYQTLPKQRELSFARAVRDAWESARRGALGRSLVQDGGRWAGGTIAQGAPRRVSSSGVARD